MTDVPMTLPDLRDILMPTIRDLSEKLEEPGLADTVITYDRDKDRLAIGRDGVIGIYAKNLPGIDLAETIRSVTKASVEEARIIRRGRSISQFYKSKYQPPWSCHAGHLILAAIRHGGWCIGDLSKHGPRNRKPDTSSGSIYIDGLRSQTPTTGLAHIDQHSSTHGRIGANIRIYAKRRLEPQARLADFVVLSLTKQSIRIARTNLPESVMAGAIGMPISKVISHPLFDTIPDTPITGMQCMIMNGDPFLFVRLQDRRMPIAPPPPKADMSFVELGNDILSSIGEEPTFLLPFDESMHLV